MSNLSKNQIQRNIDDAKAAKSALDRSIYEWEKQKKSAVVSEPAVGTMFTISVRFEFRGKDYQFLVLRHGERWYTTGTTPKTKMFPSWVKFVEWLEGEDVYQHSDLEVLQSAGTAYNLDTGLMVNIPTEGPPF